MTALRWTAPTFRTQLVITTTALVALAMVVFTLGVQLVLAEVVSRNVDTVLQNRADSVVGAVESSSDHRGGLEVPASALEPGVMVFSSTGDEVAGGMSPVLRDPVYDLRSTEVPRTVNVGESHRLYAEPFDVPSSGSGPATSGVIVVSERLDPYEQTERYALFASLALGVIVTAAAGFIVHWVTRRALAPVAMMAERAADWSEHDLTRRFELGQPTNEITALGATLDQLLERVSMAIRAEQRLTSELAHELRTPLTSIQGAADLALLRGGLSAAARQDLEQVAESSRAMGSTISALLDLARTGDPGSSTSEVGQVVSAVTTMHQGAPITVELHGQHQVRLSAPEDLAVRALIPLVDNAVRYATSRVTIATRVEASYVEVVVDDDGPGLARTDDRDLFEPGVSGREGGTGLGLAIARRTARSLGGDIAVERADRGASFVLRLPRL